MGFLGPTISILGLFLSSGLKVVKTILCFVAKNKIKNEIKRAKKPLSISGLRVVKIHI